MKQGVTGRIAFGKVIKGEQATIGPARKLSGIEDHSPADRDDGEQPVILVNKNGDVVESIEVVCTCGRTIRAYLDYDKE